MFRGRNTGILLLVTGLALACWAPSASATFHGLNGKIVFERGTDLWVMNPDGSGQTALTTPGSTDDSHPAWSPDGRQIAFQRTTYAFPNVSDSIWVMNADGSNPTQLTPSSENDRYPAWSPDGRRIAFLRSGSSADGISVMNKDGSAVTQLTPSGGSNLDWSPDGARIVYEHFDPNASNEGIYIINADGTGERLLTPVPGPTDYYLHPDWAPDGSRIVVNFACGMCHTSYGGLYTLNPETGAETRVDSLTGSDAVFSPDGTKVMYVGPGTSYPQDTGIFTANLDGTGVTHPADSGEQPDWQPLVNFYPRPRGATPLRVPLIPAYAAYEQCTSPAAMHGPPLSYASCSPPRQASPNLTIGTPDANGQAANSIGFVNWRVFYCPLCASPVNEDVFIHAELTDVRNKADLSDYGGELQVRSVVRITDEDNGPAANEGATVRDFDFAFTVPCAKTSDTGIGSTCSVDTSLQALYPGAVREGNRAIWELDSVRVYDGGPDGVASTPDNSLFEKQGVFIP
jgi:Tol biopolymer transport system component